MLQDESDQKAGEDRRKSAPRINEDDGPRADAGRKQLLLVGVEGVGHHVVAECQARSEQHDGRGAARLAEGQVLPKSPGVVGVRMPLLTRPGAILPVKSRS